MSPKITGQVLMTLAETLKIIAQQLSGKEPKIVFEEENKLPLNKIEVEKDLLSEDIELDNAGKKDEHSAEDGAATEQDNELEELLKEQEDVKTDSSGELWDQELHASTKTKTADGRWKKKRQTKIGKQTKTQKLSLLSEITNQVMRGDIPLEKITEVTEHLGLESFQELEKKTDLISQAAEFLGVVNEG